MTVNSNLSRDSSEDSDGVWEFPSEIDSLSGDRADSEDSDDSDLSGGEEEEQNPNLVVEAEVEVVEGHPYTGSVAGAFFLSFQLGVAAMFVSSSQDPENSPLIGAGAGGASLLILLALVYRCYSREEAQEAGQQVEGGVNAQVHPQQQPPGGEPDLEQQAQGGEDRRPQNVVIGVQGPVHPGLPAGNPPPLPAAALAASSVEGSGPSPALRGNGNMGWEPGGQ